jgi:anti-sigma factor RsiW
MLRGEGPRKVIGLVRHLRDKRDDRLAQRHMSDYVDRELLPRRRRRLEAHARLCPECGPLRRSLIVLVWELRQLGRARPTETVAGGVIERLRSEPLPPEPSGPATRLR